MNYTKKMQTAVLAVSLIGQANSKDELAKNKMYVTMASDEISRKLEVPKRYLEATLQKLVQKKILCSSRGPSGGYMLAKDPSAIRVSDIIRVIGDEPKVKKTGRLPEDRAVRQVFADNKENLLSRLKFVTIDNMHAA